MPENFEYTKELIIEEEKKRNLIETIQYDIPYDENLAGEKSDYFLEKKNEILDYVESGYEVDHIVTQVREDIGFGVFAYQDIKKGEYIGEYIGEVYLEGDEYENDDYQMVYIDHMWFVTALKKGNFTRHINHSYDPNLDFIRIRGRDKLLHVVFFATRNIEECEQLTYSYGTGYWKSRNIDPEDI